MLLHHFSYPTRHSAHRQVPDAGVWVSGERSQAVHGWLWCHPCHEQCQTISLPGKQEN